MAHLAEQEIESSTSIVVSDLDVPIVVLFRYMKNLVFTG